MFVKSRGGTLPCQEWVKSWVNKQIIVKNNSNASAILNKYIISIEVLVEVEIELGISQAAYEHQIPFPDNLKPGVNENRSTVKGKLFLMTFPQISLQKNFWINSTVWLLVFFLLASYLHLFPNLYLWARNITVNWENLIACQILDKNELRSGSVAVGFADFSQLFLFFFFHANWQELSLKQAFLGLHHMLL